MKEGLNTVNQVLGCTSVAGHIGPGKTLMPGLPADSLASPVPLLILITMVTSEMGSSPPDTVTWAVLAQRLL